MRQFFYLATCNTCKKIMDGLDLSQVTLRELKSDNIHADELDNLHRLTKDYTLLFSKRAMKYRQLGLKELDLSQKDMRKWILEEYTFLRRPILIVEDQIFIGNSKIAVKGMHKALNNL